MRSNREEAQINIKALFKAGSYGLVAHQLLDYRVDIGEDRFYRRLKHKIVKAYKREFKHR